MSEHTTIRTIKHTFTKYGRTTTGTEKRDDNEPWHCQSCTCKVPYEIDPYVFQIRDNEYVRICPSCQKKVIDMGILTLARLIRVCRLKLPDITL